MHTRSPERGLAQVSREASTWGQLIPADSNCAAQHDTRCLLHKKCRARGRPSPLPATGGSEDPAGEYCLPLLPFPVTLQAAQLHSPHGCHFILHLNVHGGVGAHLNGGKQTQCSFQVTVGPPDLGHGTGEVVRGPQPWALRQG